MKKPLRDHSFFSAINRVRSAPVLGRSNSSPASRLANACVFDVFTFLQPGTSALRTAAAVLLCGILSTHAQEDRTNAPRVYRDQVDAHWFGSADGETNQFWYRVNVASNRYEFILVNAQTGTRQPA